MSNFLRAKRLEVFVIVTIIAVIGIIYALTRTANAPSSSSDTQAVQQVGTSDVTYDGQDGRNALELLKVFHRVDTKDTSYGPQIIGIDGLTPDSSHYWAFYVNGSLAQVGADKYVTHNNDKIEWKVEGF